MSRKVGPDQLVRALSTLVRFGSFEVAEPGDGSCTINPAPGGSAIR